MSGDYGRGGGTGGVIAFAIFVMIIAFLLLSKGSLW
jgi:hypothetical protein